MTVLVCMCAIRVQVPRLSRKRICGDRFWPDFRCQVGREMQAHTDVGSAREIRATGNSGQILRRHSEAEEKAHCPGYLEQRMMLNSAAGVCGAEGTGGIRVATARLRGLLRARGGTG